MLLVNKRWNERIRERREALGLSYQGLAKESGVSRAQIINLESGITKYPRPDTLRALAEALGVDVSEIDPAQVNTTNHVNEGRSPYATDISMEQAARVLAARSPNLSLKEAEEWLEMAAELDEWDANMVESMMRQMIDRKRKSTEK